MFAKKITAMKKYYFFSALLFITSCGGAADVEKSYHVNTKRDMTDTASSLFALQIDSIPNKTEIVSAIDTDYNAKRVIYQISRDEALQAIIFSPKEYTTVALKSDTNNGGDTYRFTISSGIDSGMSIEYDVIGKRLTYYSQSGDETKKFQTLK